MERVFRRRPFVAALLVAAMAAEPVISRGQTSQPDQLRQELEAMKEQLRQVQQQMKKQDATEFIRHVKFYCSTSATRLPLKRLAVK